MIERIIFGFKTFHGHSLLPFRARLWGILMLIIPQVILLGIAALTSSNIAIGFNFLGIGFVLFLIGQYLLRSCRNYLKEEQINITKVDKVNFFLLFPIFLVTYMPVLSLAGIIAIPFGISMIMYGTLIFMQTITLTYSVNPLLWCSGYNFYFAGIKGGGKCLLISKKPPEKLCWRSYIWCQTLSKSTYLIED